MVSRTTTVGTGAAGAVLLLLAGCAEPRAGAVSVYATPSVPVCTKQTVATRTPGRLTIGTGDPAVAPWFSRNRPENGTGFESAVAYAVADRLGFAAAEVSWVRVDAKDAVTAGTKPFDVGIDMFAHSPERKKLVEMSSWYYLDRQAVVTLRTSAFADVDTVAALREARLGVLAASTGALAAGDLIRPTGAPRPFDEIDDARRALWRKEIDGIVVDLPSAFAMVAGKPDGLVVAGQLPRVGVPEQFGLVMAKGSALKPCVKKAVDDLRADGTLLDLEKQWLVRAAGVPELT
jgi:polar amino acid transport system substrate-binding protein